MPDLTPAELAAQQGPAALLGALRDLGGEASPSELRLRTSMASSTVSKWLAELRRAALVEGPKPRPHLTAEGWALADRGAPARTGGSLELSEAIARWPAEPQRAFLRMLVAAVIARWHLAGQRPERHPGFVAAGRTGTGKTSMGRFVCRVFGIDADAQVVYLGGRTAGEILGRREFDHEHTGAYRFDPSPLLGRPLVVFDEFDKADREQQRAALLCFQGDTRAVIEETPVELRAVPMLACNVQERLPIPPEYRRRSIVLDLDPLVDLLGDLDLALYELDAAGGPPRLELAKLRPPAARLPSEVYRLLRDVLRSALTEEGWALCNVDAVELLTLGYAAGADPDAELDLFALHAARDYLTCAETVGETRPQWRREIAGVSPGTDVAATLEAGQAERERAQLARQQRAAVKARESLELVGERQRFAEQLRQARPDARKLLPEHRPAAQGLRAQLDHLRDDVLASRSEQRLAELQPAADALLASVRELHAGDEQARTAAAAAAANDAAIARQRREAERAQQADQRRRLGQDRAAQADAAKSARAQHAAARKRASSELDAIRAEARPLEALWKRTSGDGALQVLRAARALGQPLLVFEQDAAFSGGGRIDRVFGALATIAGQGTWRSTFNPQLRVAGSASSCEQLDRWGPTTRAVLTEPLRRLHEREDHLQAAAGRKPRQSRAPV